MKPKDIGEQRTKRREPETSSLNPMGEFRIQEAIENWETSTGRGKKKI